MYINRWSEIAPWKTSFLAASMGIEYGVVFKTDAREMLQDDNGIERWILSKHAAKDLVVKKFERVEEGNIVVFYGDASYHQGWLSGI